MERFPTSLKVLEDTNLKLASVVTDVTGVSARAILRAYLSGEETELEAAHGASHSKHAYLGEQYRRLARRIGKKSVPTLMRMKFGSAN